MELTGLPPAGPALALNTAGVGVAAPSGPGRCPTVRLSSAGWRPIVTVRLRPAAPQIRSVIRSSHTDPVTTSQIRPARLNPTLEYEMPVPAGNNTSTSPSPDTHRAK